MLPPDMVMAYAETEDSPSENNVTAKTAKIALEFNLCVLFFRILKTFLLNDLLARIAKKVGKRFYFKMDLGAQNDPFLDKKSSN
jgi:hypothetical protein